MQLRARAMVARAKTDKVHDIFRRERRPLDPFFSPRTVAVIGATETPGSVGRTILHNLITSPFGGTVFPVSKTRESVLGIKAYPRIADVPARVELAVIVTPAATVPGVIRECADAEVPAAIIISAGFKELGAPGQELERRVLEEARRGGVRIIGPNCLGVMNPLGGLNATFAGAMARAGSVAFISQSGALLTAILDWSLRAQVGFSAFVSVGSMLDVGWGDLIDHIGDDPRTRAILLYMESLDDPRGFISAAREVALSKPIIVIKAGRTTAAASAAASHTGALAGADDVLDAVFRRIGVLRVDRIAELFHMADVLSKQPRPTGPRLTIVTNAGGPGVLATDALIAAGGQLAELGRDTVTQLDAVLPSAWSHGNPIDVLGDADAARYSRALQIAASDPASDGLLVILTPQAMTDPTLTAEELGRIERPADKPLLASWMGGADVEAGTRILTRANIPVFGYPDTAARAFWYMWAYSRNLRALYETPSAESAGGPASAGHVAASIIDGARAAGRQLLDEAESKRILAAYGIPTVETRFAATADAAVAAAEAIGFPIVVKLASKTITHKTDVGGVALDLGDRDAVFAAFERIRREVGKRAGAEHFDGVTVQPMIQRSEAYELLVGSSLDPQFGPVIAFGAGGQLVEVVGDRALGLPPLTRVLARRMIEATRIATALRGVRGRAPVDLAALEQLLVRFAQLVVEQRFIREIDINPLLASSAGLVALDARVILHAANVPDAAIPRPAIRPYPTQYVWSWSLADGTEVVLRPIRPEDEPLIVDFHRRLSDQSVRLRYFQALPLGTRTAHDRLVRVCFVDYDRDLVLVAVRRAPNGTGGDEILAVGRLAKPRWHDEGEFAVLISDPWQRRGLGSEILRRLVEIAAAEGLERLAADILPENTAMQRLASRLGFTLTNEQDVVRAVISLHRHRRCTPK